MWLLTVCILGFSPMVKFSHVLGSHCSGIPSSVPIRRPPLFGRSRPKPQVDGSESAKALSHEAAAPCKAQQLGGSHGPVAVVVPKSNPALFPNQP